MYTEAKATIPAGGGSTTESRVARPTTMMYNTVGTGVNAVANVIQPTPSTPSIYRYISAFRRPTAAEVGRDE